MAGSIAGINLPNRFCFPSHKCLEKKKKKKIRKAREELQGESFVV